MVLVRRHRSHDARHHRNAPQLLVLDVAGLLDRLLGRHRQRLHPDHRHLPSLHQAPALVDALALALGRVHRNSHLELGDLGRRPLFRAPGLQRLRHLADQLLLAAGRLALRAAAADPAALPREHHLPAAGHLRHRSRRLRGRDHQEFPGLGHRLGHVPGLLVHVLALHPRVAADPGPPADLDRAAVPRVGHALEHLAAAGHEQHRSLAQARRARLGPDHLPGRSDLLPLDPHLVPRRQDPARSRHQDPREQRG